MTDCIFCKIINKEVPSDIVYEDKGLMVFKDIKPMARYHFLIAPKEHFASVNEVSEENLGLIGRMVYRAREIARQFGFAASGYKLIFNCGKDGGQVVGHLHLHLLGGEPLPGVI